MRKQKKTSTPVKPLIPKEQSAGMSIRPIENGFVVNKHHTDGDGNYHTSERFHRKAPALPSVLKPATKAKAKKRK